MQAMITASMARIPHNKIGSSSVPHEPRCETVISLKVAELAGVTENLVSRQSQSNASPRFRPCHFIEASKRLAGWVVCEPQVI